MKNYAIILAAGKGTRMKSGLCRRMAAIRGSPAAASLSCAIAGRF
ncbi:bifunctional N-acetylglucosamine-1-phosphate uridyltransferase/glucosamine-1-phosphate acetyltransferase [Streptococcus equi subsp. equi]|nr:bifunctional N-acetylglucosamine-1-phosphate uridyltransferase/glucosamine-1-phosphate acetyltransferase [Streptococcus equi subsp. equi]